MSLLRTIQHDLVDDKMPLAATLRKCKLLAARLHSEPLQAWLIHESNGYPPEAAVPNYRQSRVRILGHFVGAFGSGLRFADIPSMCIPEAWRDYCRDVEMRTSIAEIEALIATSNDQSLRWPIEASVVAQFSQKIYERLNCLSAWREIPRGLLVEIVNVVRNKTLDFVIEIERKSPDAGDAPLESPTLRSTEVNQVFNTTIIGGSANVVGQAEGSTIISTSVAGDISEVRKALASNGVSKEDLDALETAFRTDPKPSSNNQFGPSVSEWMGTMISKAASGTWRIGTSAAASLLAKVIAAYYGIAG